MRSSHRFARALACRQGLPPLGSRHFRFYLRTPALSVLKPLIPSLVRRPSRTMTNNEVAFVLSRNDENPNVIHSARRAFMDNATDDRVKKPGGGLFIFFFSR